MQGFLPGSRGTFMLDFVSLAMLAVVPLLLLSIWLVRRKRYRLHKKIQIFMSSALLVTIVLFEVDIRYHGWKHLAQVSPYYETWLFPVFYVHLAVAISTTFGWAYTFILALRKMPNPPGPSPFSSRHIRMAWLSSIGMIATAVTGWLFYWAAFIA